MKAITFLVLCFLALSLTAQPLTKSRDVQYADRSGEKRFLFQDQRGLVWIGSEGGLLRYQGNTARQVIPGTEDATAFSYQGDSIYIGTTSGKLSCISLKTGRKISEARLDSLHILDIAHYAGLIVIGTEGAGAWILQGQDTLHLNVDKGLSDGTVYASAYDSDAGLLFLATDRGVDVVKISKENKTVQVVRSFSEMHIATDLEYFQNKLYVSTYKSGLFTIDEDLHSAILIKDTDGPILQLLPYNGNLFGLSANGIVQISQNHETALAYLYRSDDIADFISIREGMLMTLHQNGHISTIDLRFRELFTGASEHVITAISGNDTVIFAASNKGIEMRARQDGSLLKTFVLKGEPVVVRLIPTGSVLYIGTFDHGIIRLDLATGKQGHFGIREGLPDENVLSMSLRNDTLWISTLGGFSSLSANGDIDTYERSATIGSTYVYATRATDDEILIGTDGKGVFSFHQGQWSPMFENSGLENETIYDFSNDGDGNTWFSTRKSGLYQYNSKAKTLEHFPASTKVSGYTMICGGPGTSVLEIGDNHLRIITASAMVEFDQDLGFSSLKGEYLNNAWMAQDGMVYFASDQTVYSYHQLAQAQIRPEPVITQLQVNLAETSLSQTNFSSDQNHFSFIFDGVWHQNPEDLVFQYKLDGLESEWNTSQNKSAVYPNLPYGKYTFLIKAGTGSKFSDAQPASYAFSISKPYYLEWWFFLVITFLIIVLIIAIVQFRVSRINRIRSIEQQRLESELANLRNQVNPHFLFNSFNTLMNMIETEPKKAPDYLQRLSDFYRKILDSDQRQVVTLAEELDSLDAYLFLQKQRFGNAIDMDIEVDEHTKASLIPSLTLQLLAENALKHNIVSQSSPLHIRVYLSENYLIFENEIAPKKETESGMGIGLQNIIKRYRVLFGSEVVVEITEELFAVKLPIIKSDHARTHS